MLILLCCLHLPTPSHAYLSAALLSYENPHLHQLTIVTAAPPARLPAGTAITTALTCVRRAWLSERFAAAGGGPGAAATRGTLLHELLQRLLVEVVGADDGAQLPGVQELEKMVRGDCCNCLSDLCLVV